MPKISEPTVEEHREAQLHQLLAAAREVVLSGGPAALSFTELARRTDLARSSIYEYFANRGELIVTLMGGDALGWIDSVRAAVEGEEDPVRAIEAFVTSQLRLVADGSHDLFFRLVAETDEPAVQAFAEEQHRTLLSVVEVPLRRVGVKSVGLTQDMMEAAIQAAATRVVGSRSDPEVAEIITTATRFVRRAVEGVTIAAELE